MTDKTTMRFPSYLSCLLLIFGMCASLASQTTPRAVDILLGKARSLEDRGRMDLAAENWRQVLLVNPNQVEALSGLARYAKQRGDTREEISRLDRLRALSPRDADDVERMRVITSADRSRLDAAGRLAMQHQPDEAMKIYREVFGNEPPPPGIWAARYYDTEAASSGGRSQAIAQLRQLCARHPENQVDRLRLARILTYDPQTRMEALRLLESIDDPSTVGDARAPWRQALLWEKDNLAIQASLQAYLKRYPDADLQNIQAALTQRQERAIRDAGEEHGYQALHKNDLAAAEASFENVLRRTPKDANAIAGLGFIRLKQNRFPEAISLFDQAHALAPERGDIVEGKENAQFGLNMQQAAAALGQNRLPAAQDAYQAALGLRPNDEQALLGMANVLVREGRPADAEVRFGQVLRQAPNNAEAKAGLAFLRLNQKKFQEASALFAEARHLDPNRKDIAQGYDAARFWSAMQQGASALEQNRPQAAAGAYQQALALRPGDQGALLGLGQASAGARDYPSAIEAYRALTGANPGEVRGWIGLMDAQLQSGNPQAALAVGQKIPPAVRQRLEMRSDYLAELALVDYRAGQSETGAEMLRRALDAARVSDNEQALNFRLQVASALMDQNQPDRAIEVYQQATQSHPQNAGAWAGLVGAYVRARDLARAQAALRSMPRAAYAAAERDQGFLGSVASIYSERGQCYEAEDFLNRSVALDQSAGRQPSEATELQLLSLWMREGNYGRAAQRYRQVIGRDRNSAEAWRGYLSALHQQKDDRAVVGESQAMPASVRAQLENEQSFLMLLASAHWTVGETEPAIQLLQQARALYRTHRQPPPLELDTQLAWAMVESTRHEDELRSLLTQMRARTDLPAGQHAAVEDIWSAWILRRAQAAIQANDLARAESILLQGEQDLPANPRIRAALAAAYAQKHSYAKALDVYQVWGMSGAEAADYRSAAGAALGAHQDDLAEQYLQRGLEHFPNDPGLLQMAAKQAVAHSQYDQAQKYLASALTAMHAPRASQRQDPSAAPSGASAAPQDAGVGSHDANADFHVFNSEPPEAGCRPRASRLWNDYVRFRFVPAAYQQAESSSDAAQPQSSSVPPQPPTAAGGQQAQGPAATSPQDVDEQKIQDEMEVIQNRNTPFIGGNNVVSGRTGDAGFDRLIIENIGEDNFVTLGNKVRLGFGIHEVYLNSGKPDGTSGLQFGTLAQGATFASQTASGYSGEAQLSTDNFGLVVGTSPQGFLIHSMTGGIRFRPGGGPFTFTAVRDNVQDSMLSYAGARDPATGTVWGGVFSNAGSVQLHHDSAGNGFYASAGVGFLRGQNVADNWNATASAGFYRRLVVTRQGGLTLGLNLSGMHYERNLSFFSLGQGGYFSPQRYYLASIPISWLARGNRLEYEINGALGVQYFATDASDFYPTQTQPSQGFYLGEISTQPNYSFAFRLGYRAAPHLYLGTFAAANNVRNFNTQSVGFSLKVLLDRIPPDSDVHVKSVPDWKGAQPFSLE